MADRPAEAGAVAISAEGIRRRGREIAARRRAQPQSGRGIVIVAGGARIFVNAYVLLAVLRRTLDCRLPVELWHFGPGEISASMAAALDGLDVTLVDAQAMLAGGDYRVEDGWQLKPFAALWSRFAEVLLLDADQVPVRDPAVALEWQSWRETGALFWPDIVDLTTANPVWAALGLPPETVTSFESGQMLLDKARHLEALATTVALNEHAPQLYRWIYGDKDTFLLGWRLTGSAYTLMPHRPFVDERALIQRDADGVPFFQHRTSCKWTYSGEQHRLPGFVHEAACLAAIATLRQRWNGRVFAPPARSSAARAAEARIVALGRFDLEVIDDRIEPLEFLPHGEFGVGRSYDRQVWYVGDGDDGRLRLVIKDRERTTYELAEEGPGRWTGERIRLEHVAVDLTVPSPDRPREDTPAVLVDQLLKAAAFPVTPQRDDELARSLVLIARVETGVGKRLHALADREREPALAARLGRLAAAVDASAIAPRPLPPRGNAIIESGGYMPGGGSLR